LTLTSPSPRSTSPDCSPDPLHSATAFAGANSFLVWFLGEITGNVSQVDREWSFLPVMYVLLVSSVLAEAT
jgi:steroid 5-alpha reductase family enzyme